jgi:hypothetical protein
LLRSDDEWPQTVEADPTTRVDRPAPHEEEDCLASLWAPDPYVGPTTDGVSAPSRWQQLCARVDAPSTWTLCVSAEEQEVAAAAAGDGSHVWDSLESLPPSLTTTSIHAAPSQSHDHHRGAREEVVVLEGLQKDALGQLVNLALSQEASSRAEVHKHAYDLLNTWAEGGAASALDSRVEGEAAGTVAAAKAELLAAPTEREQEAAAAAAVEQEKAAAAQEEARRRKHEQLEQAQRQLEAEERRLHAELEQAQEQKEVRLRARVCSSFRHGCAFTTARASLTRLFFVTGKPLPAFDSGVHGPFCPVHHLREALVSMFPSTGARKPQGDARVAAATAERRVAHVAQPPAAPRRPAGDCACARGHACDCAGVPRVEAPHRGDAGA